MQREGLVSQIDRLNVVVAIQHKPVGAFVENRYRAKAFRKCVKRRKIGSKPSDQYRCIAKPFQNVRRADRVEPFTGLVLAKPLVVVPILRAGLGMLQPFHDIFPDVSVGYVGLERDHTTAVARSYYCKLPPLADTRVIVVDPMLATGGSAVQAVDVVKAAGGREIVFVCIVASPEGVATLQKAHPEVAIHTGALDRALNAKKYILPGLGDFGDRLYGT